MGFHARWHSPASARATMRELVADVAPPMVRWGYDITQVQDGRLRFERETRPGWTYLVAVFVFPVGLLALLYKDRERITIDLDEFDDGTTQLVVIGTAPLPVRRAFAELQDKPVSGRARAATGRRGRAGRGRSARGPAAAGRRPCWRAR